MSANDYITDVTANLTEWGIDYRETAEGISVGNIHLNIADDGYRPAGTILDGTEAVAITSDADKAAALLAFPLARRAWSLGYAGDFQVTYVAGGEVEMILSCGASDLAISAGIDEADRFAITGHDLLRRVVCMSDLGAAITSTELAYSNPDEAWRALCLASDLDMSHWEEIVTFFNEDAQIYQGDQYSKVESFASASIALVEEDGPDSPIRVINVDTFSYTTHRAMSDAAAAILCAIS